MLNMYASWSYLCYDFTSYNTIQWTIQLFIASKRERSVKTYVRVYVMNFLWETDILLFAHLSQRKWQRAFVFFVQRFEMKTTRVKQRRATVQKGVVKTRKTETALRFGVRKKNAALRKCCFNGNCNQTFKAVCMTPDINGLCSGQWQL